MPAPPPDSQKMIAIIALPHALATPTTYRYTVLSDLGNVYEMTVSFGPPIVTAFEAIYVPHPPA
jgi:hypothetical protein